jgi:probable HAF family extracellular repeat protein
MQIFFGPVKVAVLAAVAFASPPQVFAQRLEILGVTGGYSNSLATSVSGNGTVIVGYSEGEGRREAFRWTKENGMISLVSVPSGYYNLAANGVSVDGSVIVGFCRALNREQLAFRWTEESGMEVLEGLQEREGGSWASDASADGSVVVGTLTRPTDQYPGEVQEAFRWTKEEGPQGLGDLPEGDNLGDASAEFGSRAVAVPADGSVIVGHDLKNGEAFRWSKDRGMRGLGRLPGGEQSWAFAVSADGSTIVGASTTSVQDEYQAVRWTTEGSIESLGKHSDGDSMSFAHGVSANGAVIVGVATGEKGPEAFRWTKEVGMVGLGALPEGYDRSSAGAISADGSVIVGYIAGDAGYHAVRWIE